MFTVSSGGTRVGVGVRGVGWGGGGESCVGLYGLGLLVGCP